LWNIFQVTDKKEDGKVWDMYSDCDFTFGPPHQDSGSGGTAECQHYNREHSFPRSWYGSSTTDPMHTDLFHMYPTDKYVNNERGNLPFGETSYPSNTYGNGSKVGMSSFTGYTGKVFEPANEYKGDFARTYFYMVTCYEDNVTSWTNTEAKQMLNATKYPSFQPWAINLLLKWSRNDKVSPKEIDRNNAVFEIQENRNPFIDYPQLAEYIWGDSINYVFDPAKSMAIKRTEITPPKSVSAQQANAENGYKLEITYIPTSVGEHEAELDIFDGGIKGIVAVSLTGICSETASIIPVGADFPDLYTENNEIVFRAYQSGTKVYIYNILGKLIYTDVCTGLWQHYPIAQSGIYLVNINGITKMILVK